ncbi:MAG TPA: hypothetical protein GX506_09865 [Firmicutes bacterium]|nr:hypothetical protein [Bacillota bacterium]
MLVTLSSQLQHTAGSAHDAGDVIRKRRKAIVVIADGLLLDDFTRENTPNLTRLLSSGACGLMVTRTARTNVPVHEYMTLGAGSRAIGPAVAPCAYSTSEKAGPDLAGDIYRRNTGLTPPPAGAVHPYIMEIIRANSHEDYTIRPGLLGEMLHRANLKTAVLGNADSNEEASRLAVCIAMDESGRVDLAYIGSNVTMKDPAFPGGRRTDFRALRDYLDKVMDESALIVIETGDTARLSRESRFLSKDVMASRKKEALSDIDAFIGAIISRYDLADTMVMLVVPTPPAESQPANNMVTPVFAFGGGIRPGLLSSPTTRRAGLITNLDIAPSILSFLELPQPAEMFGRPVESARPGDSRVPSRDPLEELRLIQGKLVRMSSQRAPVSKAYVGFQIIAVTLVMLGLLLPKGSLALVRDIANSGLIVAMSVPLAMLLTSPFASDNIAWTITLIALGAVALATGASLAGRPGMGTVGLLAVFTVTGLCVDCLAGGRLIHNSLLSYDVLGGARYYGIGNEYMGVILGAAIVGVGACFDAFAHGPAKPVAGWEPAIPALGRVTVAAWFLFALAVIGFPQLGANVGGFLSGAIGFGLAYLLLTRKKVHRAHIIAMAALLIILTAGLALYDAFPGASRASHLGRLVTSITTGGARELTGLIHRKLGMNLRLLRYTIWTRVLAAFVVAIAMLIHRPVGVLAQVLARYPAYARVFPASLVAAGAAFVLNDSGVVAAATVMLFPVMSLLYLVTREFCNMESMGVGKRRVRRT